MQSTTILCYIDFFCGWHLRRIITLNKKEDADRTQRNQRGEISEETLKRKRSMLVQTTGSLCGSKQ